jgi:hypothetical protein
VRTRLSHLFSELNRYDDRKGWFRKQLNRLLSQIVDGRGSRLGFLGDIFWLHNQGLLDVLVLSSTYYSALLAKFGFSSLVVPRGYHSEYGSVLSQERDLAAVWMGKLRTRRRKHAVYWIYHELEKRGQIMQIYDGVKNPLIFGEKRTQILNRAWFVPNIFFSDPSNELSIRFFMAAANGAVVITEPSLHSYPFVPGKHLVESSIEEMPDKIMYYLEHQTEWYSLSTNMLSYMQNTLHLETSLANIMAEVERVLSRSDRKSVPPNWR